MKIIDWNNSHIGNIVSKVNYIKEIKYNQPILTSHKINKKIDKRYDFMFLNKKRFSEYETKYNYINSIMAENDYSLIEIKIK